MRRGAGILLHVTSLPSRYGIGDLGPEARQFIDFLESAHQKYWQILPLSPTDSAQGNSPYSSESTFALNPLLISPDRLVEDGYLGKGDLEPLPDVSSAAVDSDAVAVYKSRLLDVACRSLERGEHHDEFAVFCSENTSWLDDFALFMALKRHFEGKSWDKWPAAIRDREPATINEMKQEFAGTINREKAIQYLLFKQWSALKQHCTEKQIQVIGDVPIYVNFDSADVWSHPEIFKLNANKKPDFVAGVPPDYFSRTGQLWGNPVYNWEVLKATGYRWWIKRLERVYHLVDLARIDHFRGLVAFWEVAAGEKSALHGKWVEAPARDFLDTLKQHFGGLPMLAEDLGMITDDVREVVNDYSLPGMEVLQFAFSEDNPMHPYLPHNFKRNSVVYTGTHDNNTVRGWFEHEAKADEKKRLFNYLGREITAADVSWEMIRLAMMSVSDLAIIPMQDLLGLGRTARMNKPSTPKGNWRWRMLPDQLTNTLADRLAEITTIYGRA